MNAKRRSALTLCLLACLATACAAHDEGQGVTVGIRPEPGDAEAASGPGDGGPVGVSESDATLIGSSNPLTVRVEDIGKMTITIVTLACAGDCADIEAVASGGHPPYAYTWDNGSEEAKRRVCLGASQKLSVTASDTAIQASEFGYAAQLASAEASANVLQACSDAGVPPPTGDFCIKNPSLEGTPGVNRGNMFVLPDWTACSVTPDVGPRAPAGTRPGATPMQVVASDGATYVGLGADLFGKEQAGGAFCSALVLGKPISFSVELRLDENFSTAPFALEIWGGSTSCAKDELLWTSPSVAASDRWQTYCGTFTPRKSYPYVSLTTPAAPAAGVGYVEVDNFRPKARCD